MQATLRPKCELSGSAIQSLDFRARFNAAVLAVKRAGKHQPGKIGEMVLEAGDILVLLTGLRILVVQVQQFLLPDAHQCIGCRGQGVAQEQGLQAEFQAG